MTLPVFSRRRLLGSLLFGLAAWLCPRPFRAAAPRLPSSAATPSPDQLVSFTSYSYGDGTELTCTSYTYACENRLRSVSIQKWCQGKEKEAKM